MGPEEIRNAILEILEDISPDEDRHGTTKAVSRSGPRRGLPKTKFNGQHRRVPRPQNGRLCCDVKRRLLPKGQSPESYGASPVR